MRGRWIAVALVGTVVGGISAVVGVRAGESLPGTNVAGVDVGGLGRADLRAALTGLEDTRTEGELPLVADDVKAGLDRSLVDVDLDASVDQALSAGRDGPVGFVLGPLLERGDRDVALQLSIDQARLSTRLDELATLVDRPSTPGGFAISGVTATPVSPTAGRTLDRDAARLPLGEALRTGQSEPVTLPVLITEPAATPADVARVTAAAQKALTTSYTLTVGAVALTFNPAEVAPLLRPTAPDGSLALTLDAAGLTALVTAKAAPLAVAPRSASFSVESAAPVLDGKDDLSFSPVPAAVSVVPAVTGRAVDVAAAATALTSIIPVGTATGALQVTAVEPPLSTAVAQGAGVTSLVGTFTTYFQAGQPRATNIRRIAELVNGTYVPAGEKFSLNGAAGERTKARGFLADSAIVDGVLVDEVGGGVSQFATTIFNAAFFAGLPIERHKPHSFYISRYPAGRESTVYFGQLDVRFRNDTSHGLLVRTSSTRSSVTVELYGDNGGRAVSADHLPRVPRPDGGFTIEVVRSVTGGDGVTSRRVFKTAYDPPPPPIP